MSKTTLAGIAVIVFVIAVVAGGQLSAAAGSNDFEIAKGERAEGESTTESAAPAPATLFVHVSGAVSNPGLYEVEAGARVADAITSAGGFAEGAETSSVNLARTLEDGEQIIVAVQGSGGTPSPSSLESPDAQGAPSSGNARSGLVNLNTAGSSELQSLPGIGEATAAKIIEDRQANGSFKSKEDLKRVAGIGEKKYEALADLVCV